MRAAAPRPEAERTPAGELRVICGSTPLEVRAALATTLQALRDFHLDDDQANTMELVLAEVMNNVVEHAYGDGTSGVIEIRLTPRDTGLAGVVIDEGVRMPDGGLPEGDLPDGADDGAAEGGFGWFLIRALARDLGYRREGRRNALRFFVPLGPPFRPN